MGKGQGAVLGRPHRVLLSYRFPAVLLPPTILGFTRRQDV